MSMILAFRSARGWTALGLAGLLTLSFLPLAPVRAAPSTSLSGTTGGSTASVVAQQPVSLNAVEVWLDRLWGLPTQAARGGVTVCSAAEVDLDGGGRLELVVSIDYSGRRFCNTLAVVEKGSKADLQLIHTWEMDDVRHAIRRNADGRLILVVPTALTDYEGTGCIAVWQRLYSMQRGALVDVSASYPEFYKARKRDVDATIAKLGKAKVDTICEVIESDKLDRFLGGSPTAGYTRAVTWMRSVDAAMRKRAARVFADIGDASSLAKLQVLSRDADRAVAASAQGDLERARKRRR